MQSLQFDRLKDKHAGETCIVIGNGPSLEGVLKTGFLDRYPTFGTNRIYLRHTPTDYVCINPLVIEQNRADIKALKCKKFIRAGMGLRGYQLQKGLSKPFSFDPDKWINEGYTVTHVCLQLAYWMGFETVLLVGVDHRYEFTGGPNETQVLSGDDPNHFDPEYFKGQQWQTPDLMKSETYYRHALVAYAQAGRRIVNLTEGTALDVFEKGDIAEWIR